MARKRVLKDSLKTLAEVGHTRCTTADQQFKVTVAQAQPSPNGGAKEVQAFVDSNAIS